MAWCHSASSVRSLPLHFLFHENFQSSPQVRLLRFPSGTKSLNIADSRTPEPRFRDIGRPNISDTAVNNFVTDCLLENGMPSPLRFPKVSLKFAVALGNEY